MKCVSALSTARKTDDALREVIEAATVAMAEGGPADLVLVFASMHHADALGRIAAEIRRLGLGRHVLGCTGESIVGEDREVEGAAALSLWSVGLPGARLEPIRLAFGDGQFAGWPEWSTGPNPPPLILLGDPFSFPTDVFLERLHEESPGTRVVGGMASGSHAPGGNRLVIDDRVFEDGAVAVRVDGPLTIRTGLCYQPTAGGSIAYFAGNNFSLVEVSTTRIPFAAAATVSPLPGSYNVGFCILNSSGSPINDNSFVSGWALVTN